MLSIQTTSQAADSDAFGKLHDLFTKDAGHMSELAHIKRFLERYSGDHQFRTQVLSGLLSLGDAAKECHCDLDLTSLQPVFHPAFVQYRAEATLQDWPLTFKWDSHLRGMLGLMDSLRATGDSGGLTPEFDFWRQRNIARCQFELGPAGKGIVHPPVAFELSSGCSVGCWFCGISAQKFGGHFSLADGGRQEWREVIESVHKVLGRGMKSGFLYWATDPLDNPDYLGFLEEYDSIVGVVPQTTTAIPLRNIELTRSVLTKWEEKRGLVNRFSVLSTGVLKRIHETFSPEELLGVELVLQNKKSNGVVKFRAGRANAKDPQDNESEITRTDSKKNDEVLSEGTIACVSGFLINIVERKVRLISPTLPSKTWPDGYIVYDTGYYSSAAELEAVMRSMAVKHMKLSLKSNLPIRFTENTKCSAENEAAAVYSHWLRLESHDFDTVGPLIQSGRMTPMEILQATSGEGVNLVKVVAVIEQLWKSGLVEQQVEAPVR